MSEAGNKILEGLRDATAGNFSRVTINGVVWARLSHEPSARMIEMDSSTKDYLVEFEEKLTAKDAEIARLLEILGSIRVYGSDTLSGRADGSADAAWYRDSVLEMRNRALTALNKGCGE